MRTAPNRLRNNGRAPTDFHPTSVVLEPATLQVDFKARTHAPAGGGDMKSAFYKYRGDQRFSWLLTEAGVGRPSPHKLIVRESFRRSTAMREFTSFLPGDHAVTVRWRPARSDWGFLVEVYPPASAGTNLAPPILARILEAFVEKTTTPEEDAALRRLEQAANKAAEAIARLVESTSPADYVDRTVFGRSVHTLMPADLQDLTEEALDALADRGGHAWRGPVLAPLWSSWAAIIPEEPAEDPVPEPPTAPSSPLDQARKVAEVSRRLLAVANLQPRLSEAEVKVAKCHDRLTKETAQLQKELAEAEADRDKVAQAILEQMRAAGGPDALLDMAAAMS